MIITNILPPNRHKILIELINKALETSGQVFSELVGQQIGISAPIIDLVPLKQVASITGGPELIGTGIYEEVAGDVEGHLLLFFTQDSVLRLVDMLQEKPLGTTTTLAEMDISALSELGNITGSFFLNAISDCTNLEICPSTPVVVTDMIEAILSDILADLSASGDSALIVETEFAGNKDIKGYFFLLPKPNALETIFQQLEA